MDKLNKVREALTYTLLILWLTFPILTTGYLIGSQRANSRIDQLEKSVQHYEERQQALISRDKALQIELADLKKYVQENRGGTGG